MNRRLPVTLVGGFLGAGKTSFLHHIISEHQGAHLAVLVENPGTLNVDAKALRGLCGAMRRTQDTVLAIPGGDDKEAQVDWIAARLEEFSRSGRYERVLIEMSGIGNPARWGQHFGLYPGQVDTFAAWAELQQIICVVDAFDFHRTIAAPPPGSSPDPWTDFQNALIDVATLVVLNKCDLLGDPETQACARLVRQVNPVAPVIATAYGDVRAEIWQKPVLAEQLGEAVERRLQPPGQGTWTPSGVPAPVITTAFFHTHRPFHPQRFWDWFNADHPGVWRVKGLIWLATRNLLVGGVSRTRWQNSCGAAGIWWAALPREEWPTDPEALMRMQENWREPYGDRRQQLTLIGDPEHLMRATQPLLQGCLLTEEEYARPLQEWAKLPDPFPVWDLEEG
jgi:G3E family GTPase